MRKTLKQLHVLKRACMENDGKSVSVTKIDVRHSSNIGSTLVLSFSARQSVTLGVTKRGSFGLKMISVVQK